VVPYKPSIDISKNLATRADERGAVSRFAIMSNVEVPSIDERKHLATGVPNHLAMAAQRVSTAA
jgi:hypothetical protein